MKYINNFWENILSFFSKAGAFFRSPLFNLGETAISLSTVIYFFIAIFLLFFLTAKLKKIIVGRILTKYTNIGVSQSVATIVRYVVVFVGLIIIFQSFGVNLNSLSFLVGALGVGIGFGLQSITNNFISGVIILFERPIKVGDRIEVDQTNGESINGDVIEISARATTILTNDNISIIVPNSNFINNTVINWSHNDRMIRINIHIGVSYNEDPRMIKKLMLKVTEENNSVLKKPPPEVLFVEFGESSLIFNLRVWTSEYTNRPRVLKSQILYAVFKKFRENNVEIPFPQRDLHLKSGFFKENIVENEEKRQKPVLGKS